MDEYHSAMIHKLVVEAASKIDGKLPAHPSHPYGRIPVAHIYHVIKSIMGRPAKECRACRIEDIKEIIQFCVDHVEEMHIVSQIKDKYKPEPEKQMSGSLASFFE